MKRLVYSCAFAIAAFLFTALALSIPILNPANKTISPPDPANPVGPLGGIIETDGTLDTTFDAGTITNGLVLASAFQPDGKLLIAGQFTHVHGGGRFGIARLDTDGTLDAS